MDPPQKGPEVRQMLPYHDAIMKMNLIQSQKPQTSNIDHGLIWSRLQFMWSQMLFHVSLSVSSQSPLAGYCPKDEQRKQNGHCVPCPKGQESSRPWHCLRSTSKRSVAKNWTSYNQTLHCLMMTSSNGNISALLASPVNSSHKGQRRRALMLSLICFWINGWVNNREAGDLRRHRANYDVIVMFWAGWNLQHYPNMRFI